MGHSSFDRQIEAARRRLEALEKRARGSADDRALVVEALEDLSAALEELHVAGEELRQQNEELAAARQIVESERQRYQDLFEFAPDAYLVTDPDLTIQEANAAAAGLLGVREDFLLGKPLTVFILPEDQSAFYKHLNRLSTATDCVARWQLSMQPREQAPFPVAVTVGVIRDGGGRPAGLRWLFRDITEQQRADRDLRRSRDQLRALAARLESVREAERTAVAKSVHDELAQGLAGVKFKLASITAQLPKDQSAWKSEADEMLVLMDVMLKVAMRISEELHSSLLDFFGLEAVIQAEVRAFQARTGILCQVIGDVADLQLDRVQIAGLFRICQKSLENIARHAQASRVTIHLHRDASQVRLTLEDDGRGITEPEIASPASLGLLRMREEAFHLDGDLSIQGQPGTGTTITVRVPLPKR